MAWWLWQWGVIWVWFLLRGINHLWCRVRICSDAPEKSHWTSEPWTDAGNPVTDVSFLTAHTFVCSIWPLMTWLSHSVPLLVNFCMSCNWRYCDYVQIDINLFYNWIFYNIFAAGGDNAEISKSDAATQADGISDESSSSTVSGFNTIEVFQTCALLQCWFHNLADSTCLLLSHFMVIVCMRFVTRCGNMSCFRSWCILAMLLEATITHISSKSCGKNVVCLSCKQGWHVRFTQWVKPVG